MNLTLNLTLNGMMNFEVNPKSIADDVLFQTLIQCRSMSDPNLFDIDFENKMTWVWTILNKVLNLMIDESHFIKTAKAKRSDSALSMLIIISFSVSLNLITSEFCKMAERVVLLSGTPALARPIELHNQIMAINPQEWMDFYLIQRKCYFFMLSFLNYRL